MQVNDTMTGKKTAQQVAQPMVRIGEQWIPAHAAWKKLQTANVVADAIERFNRDFPHLASANTRNVVSMARQRLREIELHMPDKQH